MTQYGLRERHPQPKQKTDEEVHPSLQAVSVPASVDDQEMTADESHMSCLQEDEPPRKGMHWRDISSVALLLLLYMLQGIPMGLCASIPLLLMERGSSYEALSLFSLVSIPFSLKIIWAPFVDTYYFPSFGRRKTWLVPIQLITGIVMICSAGMVSGWIREKEFQDYSALRGFQQGGSNSTSSGGFSTEEMQSADGQKTLVIPMIDTFPLTIFFFLLYLLMATQDIAVDGWALTMLSRENVGYASVCNAIGQSLGVFFSNQGFLALSDVKWCRTFLDSDPVVTLSSFMVFWGWVFIVTTLAVMVLKQEVSTQTDAAHSTESPSITETIGQIASICKLKSVSTFCIVLFTCKAFSSPIDAGFQFKLQEYGMSKSDLTTIGPLLLATALVFPALASGWVTQKPLEMFAWGIKCKLGTSLLMWLVFQLSADLFASGGAAKLPLWYYFILSVSLLLHECAGTLIFVSCMAFFSRISDPTIGGSYMTLLNTLANLGTKWPSALSLYLIPKLTVYSPNGIVGARGIVLDGMTVLLWLGLVGGLVWLHAFKPVLKELEALPHSDWRITQQTKSY